MKFPDRFSNTFSYVIIIIIVIFFVSFIFRFPYLPFSSVPFPCFPFLSLLSPDISSSFLFLLLLPSSSYLPFLDFTFFPTLSLSPLFSSISPSPYSPSYFISSSNCLPFHSSGNSPSSESINIKPILNPSQKAGIRTRLYLKISAKCKQRFKFFKKNLYLNWCRMSFILVMLG